MELKKKIQKARQRLFGIKPSIGQFQKIIELLAKQDDGEFARIQREAEFCAILENIPIEEAEGYTLSQIMKINKLYIKPKSMNEISVVPMRFLVGSRVFKTTPEFKDFTTAEHIAFSQWTISEESINENLHKIIGLCTKEFRFPYFRAKKETSKDFFIRAKFLQEHCPAEIASSLAGFFLHSQELFWQTIPKVLNPQQTQKN
jgi:hypothetical protein